MSINIVRTNSDNFPDKVAVCGLGPADESLILGARRKRVEWAYGKLRKGLLLNTATDHGEVAGQITALPISESPIEIECRDSWYIPCIWMPPGHASPFLGEQLVAKVVAQLRGKAKALLTISSENWMNHRSFLESFGFECRGEISRVGGSVDIMALPMSGEVPPVEIFEKKLPPERPGRVDFFFSRHCPTHNITLYRLRKELAGGEAEFELRVHCADDRDVIREYGYSFGLFYNGQSILRPYLQGSRLADLIKER